MEPDHRVTWNGGMGSCSGNPWKWTNMQQYQLLGLWPHHILSI